MALVLQIYVYFRYELNLNHFHFFCGLIFFIITSYIFFDTLEQEYRGLNSGNH